MAENRTNIADALFTKTQQRVLGFLFGQPDRSYYLNELVSLASVGKGTVRRELDKLVSSGLITLKKVGNQTHYQANSDSPVFDELCLIIKKTSGLVDTLLSALKPLLSQVELAFVYGSVAKGADHAASDIDLMLVGEEVDYSALITALLPVEEELGREIHPTVLKPKELVQRISSNQSFVTRVLAQEKLWLLGENNLAKYLSTEKH